MDQIEFSVGTEVLVPAPREFVWRHLVEPELIPLSQPHIARAITVEGTAGDADHTFFIETRRDDHLSEVFKIRVLRAQALEIWATLMEVPGRMQREYYTLSETENGLFTSVKSHLMCREIASEKVYGDLRKYKASRVRFVQDAKRSELDIFASAIAALHDH